METAVECYSLCLEIQEELEDAFRKDWITEQLYEKAKEELAKAMGRAGRERAASMFSLSRVVDEYEGLFSEFLDI
jgi:glycosyltransferase involved in cell wall biosynthesis